MSFKDFDELVAPEPKQLPIGGRTYEFPAKISAETGMLLLRLYRARADVQQGDAQALLASTGLTDDQMQQLTDDMVGPALEEMVLNGHGGALGRVIGALTAWHLYGREAAEHAWNSVGPTSAPNRAARRTSKATATSTKRQASTAGTTARRKPAPRS